MALTSKSSGSTAMSLGSDVTLATITDAGIYEFSCDVSPIVDGETLLLIIEKKILTGSTRRQIDRVVIAKHAQDSDVVEDKPRTSLFEIVYKLRQEGGSARTIDWQIASLQ